MRTRSIPFTAPMVLAIRARRKTQTRRIVTPQPGRHGLRERTNRDRNRVWAEQLSADGRFGVMENRRCPYGVPGDVLLVKESWCVDRRYDDLPPSKLPAAAWRTLHWMADGGKPRAHGRTRPGRFLPNARVRTRLEVTSVRVERVQGINEVDAVAEGMTLDTCESIMSRRARRARVRPGYYVIRDDGADKQQEWCDRCVDGVDGSRRLLSGESDTPAWCATCFVLLEGDGLTEYGMARELFLEGHKGEERPHWPLSPDDAHIAARFCRDLPDHMMGRLAQIAFATLWDQINGTGAWARNEFVWVVEFKVQERTGDDE